MWHDMQFEIRGRKRGRSGEAWEKKCEMYAWLFTPVTLSLCVFVCVRVYAGRYVYRACCIVLMRTHVCIFYFCSQQGEEI